MLTELCHELNNWFDTERHFGLFTIENGELSVSFLQNGQYFRIVGSVFNDGVHQYPDTRLSDETFDGAVWAMAVPPAIMTLAGEIEAWQAKYGGINSAALSPFQSESFGGYSYSKGSGAATGNVQGITWQMVFRSQLNCWRKI